MNRSPVPPYQYSEVNDVPSTYDYSWNRKQHPFAAAAAVAGHQKQQQRQRQQQQQQQQHQSTSPCSGNQRCVHHLENQFRLFWWSISSRRLLALIIIYFDFLLFELTEWRELVLRRRSHHRRTFPWQMAVVVESAMAALQWTNSASDWTRLGTRRDVLEQAWCPARLRLSFCLFFSYL